MNRWTPLEEAIISYGLHGVMKRQVRAVKETNGWGAVEKGDTGVLADVDPNGTARADFPVQEAWVGSWQCFEVLTADEEDIP